MIVGINDSLGSEVNWDFLSNLVLIVIVRGSLGANRRGVVELIYRIMRNY